MKKSKKIADEARGQQSKNKQNIWKFIEVGNLTVQKKVDEKFINQIFINMRKAQKIHKIIF